MAVVLCKKTIQVQQHDVQAVAIGHLEVESETGSRLYRTALWQCFGDAVSSLIGH